MSDDELEILSGDRKLLFLLGHYADLAGADPKAWQDRLMAMVGVKCSELSRLHGELIAFGWIEQNTGDTVVVRAGSVPACYRATSAGIKAVRQARRMGAADESEAESAVKESVPTMTA